MHIHILSLVPENQRKEENDLRNYFMINLHESMGLGGDQTHNPWICSHCAKPWPEIALSSNGALVVGLHFNGSHAGFYTKLNVWGSLGLSFDYDGRPIIENGGPIFLYMDLL